MMLKRLMKDFTWSSSSEPNADSTKTTRDSSRRKYRPAHVRSTSGVFSSEALYSSAGLQASQSSNVISPLSA
eukprot:CAMPEP_0194758586 /NCGR_PEP_ID=MMETSP0323_2-20130528/11828_1 /TAXON_ID=2866 ORGANISM="Crypthecodinium cohnii, Strain Seligo" /NCGR_SAMPLE_ID=MMETSP0323_2 /ASSEMBLY_ACC=CAM_ASM_000346 /LENGTH=71 /DNA_ID=CAMNT_0039678973 /DNA_START=332 /DNA_END=547 /DNA_ORIENTATION=-